MKEIEEMMTYLSGPTKFRCASCNDESKSIIVEVSNIIQKNNYDSNGCNDLNYISDNYRSVLLYYNSLNVDGMKMEYGIQLFSCDEAEVYMRDLLSNEAKLDGYTLIGRNLSSGDIYIADEAGFYFIAEENILFSNTTVEALVPVASNLKGFLEVLGEDPIKYINGVWRYMEDFMNQWYPVSVVRE
jgi:hypothetical protein